LTIFEKIATNLGDPSIQELCTKEMLGTLLTSTRNCLMFEDCNTIVCATRDKVTVQDGRDDIQKLYTLVLNRHVAPF
jgi:hypothetical protein